MHSFLDGVRKSKPAFFFCPVRTLQTANLKSRWIDLDPLTFRRSSRDLGPYVLKGRSVTDVANRLSRDPVDLSSKSIADLADQDFRDLIVSELSKSSRHGQQIAPWLGC